MEETGRKKSETLYKWVKRGVVTLALFIWIFLMAKIFLAGGGMQKQAPQCIFSTMIVFGVLTLIYNAIEKMEKGVEDHR